MSKYQALLIEKDGAGYRASIQSLDEDNLPEEWQSSAGSSEAS